jgi:2-polyprenyl-3-methyl-5-hydroxy-6-metoxy-1,4-benzoquinol methylase
MSVHNSVSAAIYGHGQDAPASEDYLFPELARLLAAVHPKDQPLFEIGVGTGWTAHTLSQLGYGIIGVEPSADGIEIARRNAPAARIDPGSAYDDLAGRYGRFRTAFALEVIEHVYSPRLFVKNAYELLGEGGHLILSTPFHGYWKNLALALSGSLDKHFTALWDHGHIKFWSEATMTELLSEAGFRNVRFSYAGRFYPISKSFFVCAQR